MCGSLPHPCHLECGKDHDLLLIQAIWQRWWDVNSDWHKIGINIYSVRKLLLLLALMKQVAVLGRVIGQGTEGDLQPTTSWELRLLVLACKYLSPANNWAGKWVFPQPNLQMRTQPWLTLWLQTCRRPRQAVPGILIHRNSEITIVSCYKLLSLWWYYYMATDNK